MKPNIKALYEEYIGSKAFLKNGESSSVQLSPNWDMGQLSNDSLWYVVESPLEFTGENKLMLMTEEVSTYTAQKKDPELAKQLLRLVVMRNKKTGDTYSFIMHFVPSLDYLLQHGNHLAENTYLSQTSDLDGSILYYTPQGKLVNGWVYKKGVVTASLRPKGSNTGLFETKSYSTNCFVYIEVGVREDGVGETTIGFLCVEDEYVISYHQFGYDFGDYGAGSAAGYFGGGGGGGGTGESKPPPNRQKKTPTILVPI